MSDQSPEVQAGRPTPAGPSPGAARPWPRYFARQVDYTLFGIVFAVVHSFVLTEVFDLPNAAYAVLVTFAWAPPEAILLSLFATTPGKWMFSLRVTRPDGDNLSLRAALSRSLRVWINGMGVGIPFVALFTNWAGYKQLTNHGKTTWDSRTPCITRQASLNGARITAGTVLVAGCLSLIAYGIYQEDEFEQNARAGLRELRTVIEEASSEVGASVKTYGGVVVDVLNHDHRLDFSIHFPADTYFVVLAACDDDCLDLDLRLVDESDEEIARDGRDDARPVIFAKARGGVDYSLHVEMYACAAEPCTFAYQLLKADAPFWQALDEGTCFLVDPTGIALTANHVVEHAERYAVSVADGRTLEANVEARDPDHDLAVLRLSEPVDASLTLSDSLGVGDRVFTLGFPISDLLGYEPKFSEGTITARAGPDEASHLLQTTVSIQPGNSGGPLVNFRGEAVGVIASTATADWFMERYGTLPQNINFAVRPEVALELTGMSPSPGVAPSREEAIRLARNSVCLVRHISQISKSIAPWDRGPTKAK